MVGEKILWLRREGAEAVVEEWRERVMGMMWDVSGGGVKAREVLGEYRVWLHGQGEAKEGISEEGQPKRPGFSREAVLRVIREEKGRLALSEYLRLRVRYFAGGAVLGRRQYVDEMFGAMRERFGPKRRDGARRLKGVKADLYSLRALRIGPLS